MLEFKVGGRVSVGAQARDLKPTSVVSAIFVDEAERFYALVPKPMAYLSTSLCFAISDGADTAALTVGTPQVEVPSHGAFAAVEVREDLFLREMAQVYSADKPDLLDVISVGDNVGTVIAFRDKITTRQGDSETDVFLVELNDAAKTSRPIVGEPVFTKDGIAGIVFGVVSDQRLLAVAQVSAIFSRFRAKKLHVATQADFLTRNYRVGQVLRPLPISILPFRRWLQESIGLEEELQFQTVDELLDQLVKLAEKVGLTSRNPINLGEETYSNIEEMLTRAPVMSNIRYDFDNSLFFEGIGNIDTTHSTLGELVRSAYPIQARESVAA